MDPRIYDYNLVFGADTVGTSRLLIEWAWARQISLSVPEIDVPL